MTIGSEEDVAEHDGYEQRENTLADGVGMEEQQEQCDFRDAFGHQSRSDREGMFYA